MEKYREKALKLRETLYTVYMQYERGVRWLVRFLMSMCILLLIKKQFSFGKDIGNGFFLFFLSMICSFLPDCVVVLVYMLVLCGFLSFLSPVLTGFVGLVCIILYSLFLYNAGKSVLYAAWVPVLLGCKVPAVAAVLLPLFFGPEAVLVLGSGTVFYFLVSAVKQYGTRFQTDADVVSLLQDMANTVLHDPEMYLLIIAVCAEALVVCFLINRKIPYAFELAVGAGCICNVLFLLIGRGMGICSDSVLVILAGSMCSAVLVFGAQFLYLALDYGAVEQVQFEDEDYYYYVRAVPKLRATDETQKIGKQDSNSKK